jgi:hypothetical protein
LQKLTDGTHFHKRIYLSYRDADRYGVSEHNFSSKNIQYEYYKVYKVSYYEEGTTFSGVLD